MDYPRSPSFTRGYRVQFVPPHGEQEINNADEHPDADLDTICSRTALIHRIADQACRARKNHLGGRVKASGAEPTSSSEAP